MRCWISDIHDARKDFLPEDSRLTSDNLSVVPKYAYTSTGWPPATDPKNVVSSILKATGCAPIPTRAYRLAGCHGWALSFGTKPSIGRFIVTINDKDHEILLVEAEISQNHLNKQKQNPKASKTFPIEKSAATNPVDPAKSQDSVRIDRLEAKFADFEVKQSRLENKIDNRFDDLGSTLRQLLAQTNGPRGRSPTGESPPSKHLKGPE